MRAPKSTSVDVEAYNAIYKEVVIIGKHRFLPLFIQISTLLISLRDSKKSSNNNIFSYLVSIEIA